MNRGVYEGLGRLTRNPARVEEKICQFSGGDFCEYHIKWKAKPIFSRILDLFRFWLSREVIVLPVFMFLVMSYGLLNYFGVTDVLFVIRGQLPVDATLLVGMFASITAFALYLSTAMIYASLKFLQEWHSPLTILNYTLLGLASGFTLAAGFAAWTHANLVGFYVGWAVIFTMLGMLSRMASIYRNARIKRVVTVQNAIGVKHTKIVQKSQGFMGGSFNTREFFGMCSKIVTCINRTRNF